MAPPGWKVCGITHAEVLVAAIIFAILGALIYPWFVNAWRKGQRISTVSCCRQIHIATMSMANDGEAEKNPAKGWPGDLKARGVIRDTADFATLLVRGNYFMASDLRCFCEGPVHAVAPGFKPYHGVLTSGGKLDPPFSEENNPFKIFLVKDPDPGPTVFLETKNYTYGKDLNHPRAKPYGDKAFIVCRKGGDVALYKKEQALDLSHLGKLPGGGTVESAENCLNP
ncbi:MAG: type II secretion system protein [Chthoniobacteraceae bacterium]